ncbi:MULTISPECIES: regulatory protein RecX [Desulfococcus]|uniref:Regulatory protein RecX n=1 Tax=Desulfococcus multivorans DSM 2059 TaxID=1121405 RepID=S7U6W9_DESML|nr:regulatory protein RecX [Desulfococcus multivorans]AOY60714.1 RecX: predicted regulatory protein [Desulfococcus multivorans]AQV02795.1 hypothetical protein B2D07_19820 [Desulfococcus multivorans]EPR44855.1 Regulatory protein recX [Desulfococcus multivorans DSM 2059]SJZ92037.1 regulatory protein [Desulfococcus multivorans DSM 2059]
MDNQTDSVAAAVAAAVRFLARRDHSRCEIVRKLRQRRFSPAAIDAAVAECERLNYLNDDRTARCYFEELVRKEFGAERIRYEMKKKGLVGDTVEALLATYAGTPGETAAARNVFEKHMRRLGRETDRDKRKARMWRFLYGRGFSADIIRDLMDRLNNGDDGLPGRKSD